MTARVVSNEISFGLVEAAQYAAYLNLVFTPIAQPLSNLFIIVIVSALSAGNVEKKNEIAKHLKINWFTLIVSLGFLLYEMKVFERRGEYLAQGLVVGMVIACGALSGFLLICMRRCLCWGSFFSFLLFSPLGRIKKDLRCSW